MIPSSSKFSTFVSNQRPSGTDTNKFQDGTSTIRIKKEGWTNNTLSSLLDDHGKGLDLDNLKKIYPDAPLGNKNKADLNRIIDTKSTLNSDVATLAAFIMPGAQLTKGAQKIILENKHNQDKSQPDMVDSVKNTAKILDKTGRIITLIKNMETLHPGVNSKDQIKQVCHELKNGKEQLNLLNGWDGAVDVLKNCIDDLQNRFNLLSGEATGKGLRINQLELELDELTKNRDGLAANLRDLQQQVSGAQSEDEVNQLKSKIEELGLSILSIQGNLNKQLGNIDDLNNHIAGLNKGIAERDDIISSLTGDKTELENQLRIALDTGDANRINELESQIAELERNIATRYQEIDELETKNNALQDTVDTQAADNKQQADNITQLENQLRRAMSKKESSGKHTAELIAGIVALIASTALFLVALLPKDETSEESVDNTVDTTDLKAELQNEATELQAQLAQDDAAIAKLDDAQTTLADISASIEEQEAALADGESDLIKDAGDKAYQQAMDEAKAAAYADPANQAFDVNEDGVIVPTGELTAAAQAECEAQADSAREAAETQVKQSIDAALQQADALDSQIQTVSDKAAATSQQMAADRIATQAQLDAVNGLNGKIPDEVSYTTQNIENTNNGLSDAGFYTTLSAASALAAGGIGLLFKFGLDSRKHSKQVEMHDAEISSKDPLMNEDSTQKNTLDSEVNAALREFVNADEELRSSTTPAFIKSNMKGEDQFN
ncbi:hypothetical protein HZV92_001843 [Salmonella enterica]|nr:hypothetical protein [Salmonella enterica]EFQ6618182.1 hypothetical protein [Salmonella enterica]